MEESLAQLRVLIEVLQILKGDEGCLSVSTFLRYFQPGRLTRTAAANLLTPIAPDPHPTSDATGAEPA